MVFEYVNNPLLIKILIIFLIASSGLIFSNNFYSHFTVTSKL